MAWHAKEVVRSVYEITNPELAGEFVDQLGIDMQDESCPPEVRSLGRTIIRWRDQIVAWHQALVSNWPTEAVNNLIKRIKRIGLKAAGGPDHQDSGAHVGCHPAEEVAVSADDR